MHSQKRQAGKKCRQNGTFLHCKAGKAETQRPTGPCHWSCSLIFSDKKMVIINIFSKFAAEVHYINTQNMKKLFGTIIMAIGLLTAIPSQAQFSFGISGGLNLNKISYKDVPDVSSNNRAGWFVGPKVQFKLPVVGIGFDAAALYSQRRINGYSNVNEDATSTSTSYKSIEIPINLRYSVGLSSLASVFIATGPQFGFNVGGKNWEWRDTKNYELRKSNVSWNIGAGVRLLNHVEANVGYNFAVSKLAKYYGIPGSNDSEGSFKANSWQLQVAYYF